MGDLSPHFSRHEFVCNCGCSFEAVDVELLGILERLRKHFGKPIHITSGCRCGMYNLAVGGAKNSFHVYGMAADFEMAGVSPEQVRRALEAWYPEKYGIGAYANWTHLDVRRYKARWGQEES